MRFGKWKVEAVNGVRVPSGGLGSQSVMEVYHMRFTAAVLGLFKTVILWHKNLICHCQRKRSQLHSAVGRHLRRIITGSFAFFFLKWTSVQRNLVEIDGLLFCYTDQGSSFQASFFFFF